MTDFENPATTGIGGEQGGMDTNPSPEVFVVGPHTVYKSVGELYEGAKQKESYISKLEAENAALQEEIAKAQNREQFKQDLQRLTTPTTRQETADTTAETETKLKELVNKALSDRDEEERKAEMQRTVEGVFGGEAQQKLEAKASELGMSIEQLKALPEKAFLTLVGIRREAGAPAGMMAGRQGMYSAAPSEAEAFRAEVIDKASQNNGAKMGELIKKAMENPSLVNNL